jgi:methylmalonyl-CoA mutase cobalamin-binding subunit
MIVTWAEREALALVPASREFFRRAALIARTSGLSAESLTAVQAVRAALELAALDAETVAAGGTIPAAEAGTSSGRTAPTAVRGTPGPSYDRGPRHVWAMLQR